MINNTLLKKIIMVTFVALVSIAIGSEDVETKGIHEILGMESCGGVSITKNLYNQWRSIEKNPVLYAIIYGDESCAARMLKYLSNDEIYSFENRNGILISAILNGKAYLVLQLLSRKLNFKECSNQLSAAVGISKNIKIIKAISEKFNMPCLDEDGKDYTFYSAVYSLNYTVIQYYHNMNWIKDLTTREKKDANNFLTKQLEILNDISRLSRQK